MPASTQQHFTKYYLTASLLAHITCNSINIQGAQRLMVGRKEPTTNISRNEQLGVKEYSLSGHDIVSLFCNNDSKHLTT